MALYKPKNIKTAQMFSPRAFGNNKRVGPREVMTAVSEQALAAIHAQERRAAAGDR